MSKHTLVIDELVSIWRRTYCEVEAESLEEAVELAKECEYEVIDSDFLYESEEILETEIYDETVTTMYYADKKSD